MISPSLEAARPVPLWWEDLDPARTGHGAPSDDLDVDVAIVGGGFTGLWTAYELAGADPSLSIAILERDHIGFGASGRNGGWCYDGFAADMERIESMSDLDTARRFGAALRENVEEVGKAVAVEGIDCDFHKGGTVEFLSNGGQIARAEAAIAGAHHYGWTDRDTRLLSRDEASEVARAAGASGALWSRHTAALHPFRLALGLADAVARRGVAIHENTAAASISPGRIVTAGGITVTAKVIVRATEGYTAELKGLHRKLAPLYSLMIATEPLPDTLWEEIGLADRQTFGELRHLVIYGQRTGDGRIAFGGRGAPYDYGSRIRANAEFPARAFAPVREALVGVFPQLADVAITHRWGGVLGVSRTWMPTAGFDPATGLAWAGGYVGSGVAATNLAGRTLADLITGRDRGLTDFPWVGKEVRNWEVEPFRWIGINAALKLMGSADSFEARRNRPAKRADLLWWLAKH